MTDLPDAHATEDAATLAFYEATAQEYAARREAEVNPALERFIEAVGPGGAVLELGCGGGQDALVMTGAGLRVTATDGSPALAAQASARLGRPVKVMTFVQLREEGRYDGIWANASLLHAPADALHDILGRAWRALKPGGLMFASFKAGEGPGRDALGRYYNFPSRAGIENSFRQAAPWSDLSIETVTGGGYDGVERSWLLVWATAGPGEPQAHDHP
ncbi:MAG: class I SAM-dependent methyltransferase [Caulobacteraceae bacterium]|nr:MAG: class I SAM-dependent methyltransferase [Caulobacteraceae bacterium]